MKCPLCSKEQGYLYLDLSASDLTWMGCKFVLTMVVGIIHLLLLLIVLVLWCYSSLH